MSNDLKRVQARLVEMAEVIENILNRNNIYHSITNGTLLGAVRHGGFIPWDDDFDFCIFGEHYEKALYCLRKELPEWLFLEDKESEPKFFHAWAHVKDLKTIVQCEHYVQDNLYAHHGLSIDLYRMERVRLKDHCSRREDEFFSYVKRRNLMGNMDDDEMKKRFGQIYTFTNNYWSFELGEENLESINRDVYADLYITARFYEVEDFFPLRKIKFENTEFTAPNDPDTVLKKTFGDYMTLPPEEERVLHYSDVEFLY